VDWRAQLIRRNQRAPAPPGQPCSSIVESIPILDVTKHRHTARRRRTSVASDRVIVLQTHHCCLSCIWRIDRHTAIQLSNRKLASSHDSCPLELEDTLAAGIVRKLRTCQPDPSGNYASAKHLFVVATYGDSFRRPLARKKVTVLDRSKNVIYFGLIPSRSWPPYLDQRSNFTSSTCPTGPTRPPVNRHPPPRRINSSVSKSLGPLPLICTYNCSSLVFGHAVYR
jgi:hypothetical protein